MSEDEEEPPGVFIAWLAAGVLGASALLALVLAHG
jgi:hypothetical protein